MNKKLLFSLLLLFALIFSYFILNNENQSQSVRELHSEILKNHPYNKTKNLSKADRKLQGLPPNAFFEQEYLSEINPYTGRTHKENVFQLQNDLEDLRATGRTPGDANDNAWVNRGPDNQGGRTRAMIFDPNDGSQQTVYAGGVSGGLWKNTNISDAGSVWTLVDIPENLAISCIAIDPNDSMIWYVGTGESYVGGDVNGTGVWRTTDGGTSWENVFGGAEGETVFEANAEMIINTPSSIAGSYYAILSTAFGGGLNPSITSDLVLADDGTGVTEDGCTALNNSTDIDGKIAVIRRGDCPFVDKVNNAQNAGAIGVIIVNNVAGLPINQGGEDSGITIPTVMISRLNGNNIIDALSAGTSVNVTLDVRRGNDSGFIVSSGVQHVNDIVVRDNAGVSEVYVAAGDALYGIASPQVLFGIGDLGVYKSTDGLNYTKLTIPNNSEGGDHEPNNIKIAADNSVYISTTSDIFGNGGGAIFQSTNTDATEFTLKHTVPDGQRTEIACSRTDASKIYVLAQLSSSPVGIYKTTDGFSSITTMALPIDADNGIPDNDFTRGQAFYDLLLRVDPNNDEKIFIGGIDLFKSTDGANSYSQISKWSNNNNLSGLNIPNVHADQHGLAFSGTSSTRMLFSNDGGVYFSNDAGVNIVERNNGYVTLQVYTVGVAPTTALTGDNFLAGAQDNGTNLFTNAPAGVSGSQEIQGGDGAYSFFDQDGTDQYYVSNYVYNNSIRLRDLATGLQRTINSESGPNGDFINQEELDSNLDILYSNYSSGINYIIKRYKNILSGSISKTDLSDNLMDEAPSAMKVSPFTTTSTKLLAGLKNGKLIQIDDADGEFPAWSEITGPDFVGTVSDIEFGESENDIFLTMHNYGVKNIWYSSDAGANWFSKEGDFPDIPVKAILQNPLRTEEVIIGTELGVWSTTNFFAEDPTWVQSNNGMKNVKVMDLDLRDDNAVYAATYGRGVFSGLFTAETASVEDVLKDNEVFTVYPTISDGNFTIFGKNDLQESEVSIFDIRGRQVYSANLDFNTSQRQEISLNASSGIYIVNLTDRNGRKSSKKIVIK